MSGIEYNGTITFSMAVKDRLKTAEWFQKHLGFKTAFDVAEIGWLEMETSVPGVTLGFGENMEAKPGNSVPVFGVKDIDATRAKLEGAGVKFDGDTIVYQGMVKLATFYDPDDNAFMLAETLMGQVG